MGDVGWAGGMVTGGVGGCVVAAGFLENMLNGFCKAAMNDEVADFGGATAGASEIVADDSGGSLPACVLAVAFSQGVVDGVGVGIAAVAGAGSITSRPEPCWAGSGPTGAAG